MKPPSDELKPCPYVLGHVTECDEISDDGGPLWQAEIQLVGGYGVAATIYAGTNEAAQRMAEQAIAAWNTRPEAAQEIERLREALEYICHQDGKGADGLIDWQRCVDRIQEVARSALTPSIKRG